MTYFQSSFVGSAVANEVSVEITDSSWMGQDSDMGQVGR